jgi:predicted O-methyltransferase YrrM
MGVHMRGVLLSLVAALDVLGAPFTFLAARWLWLLRRIGVQRLPVSRRVLFGAGVFPIRDHYYEPLFHPRHLRLPLDQPRALPGLDLDVPGQLILLETLRYGDELLEFPLVPHAAGEFGYLNRSFGPGDAEILYAMLRHFRPRRMIEIGSGNSTLLAAAALRRNRAESPGEACEHVCVEPYEMPWLERAGVKVLRQRVEDVGLDMFRALDRNDVLFIDSSHVIRPQGDVLTEFLTILPSLRPGVIVHVHDIYTPRDYPDRRLRDEVRFWNEQSLLEAFLSGNHEFHVLLALNHLWHDHRDALDAACPVLAKLPGHEPASFWMMRG